VITERIKNESSCSSTTVVVMQCLLSRWKLLLSVPCEEHCRGSWQNLTLMWIFCI